MRDALSSCILFVLFVVPYYVLTVPTIHLIVDERFSPHAFQKRTPKLELLFLLKIDQIASCWFERS